MNVQDKILLNNVMLYLIYVIDKIMKYFFYKTIIYKNNKR